MFYNGVTCLLLSCHQKGALFMNEDMCTSYEYMCTSLWYVVLDKYFWVEIDFRYFPLGILGVNKHKQTTKKKRELLNLDTCTFKEKDIYFIFHSILFSFPLQDFCSSYTSQTQAISFAKNYTHKSFMCVAIPFPYSMSNGSILTIITYV